MVRVCVEGYRDGEEGRNVASFVGGWLPLGAQTPPLSRILPLTLCASVQQHGYGAAYGANGQRGRWDAQASKRIQDAPRDGYVITHVHSEQPGAGAMATSPEVKLAKLATSQNINIQSVLYCLPSSIPLRNYTLAVVLCH